MLAHHPVFWILLAAVVAPLVAEIPVSFRVPVVVLEVVLGIVIGPHGLGVVQFDGFVAAMFTLGMAASLFMAGLELDWERLRGRPLSLAARGWIVSLLLAAVAASVLHFVPTVQAPMVVALALTTTSLGVLLPVFRDAGQLDTSFAPSR
jgi:Kef-type K+ transport system membrane component KefB